MQHWNIIDSKDSILRVPESDSVLLTVVQYETSFFFILLFSHWQNKKNNSTFHRSLQWELNKIIKGCFLQNKINVIFHSNHTCPYGSIWININSRGKFLNWDINMNKEKHIIYKFQSWNRGFLGDSDGEEYTCSTSDLGLIPGLGRSPGEGNCYPLQYSCLENSTDWGALQSIALQRVRHDWATNTFTFIVTIKPKN